MNLMTAINEKTTITIGLVIALIGGSGFLTKLWFATEAKAEANTEAIITLKSDLKEDLRAIKVELKEQNRLLIEVLSQQAKIKK